MELSTIADNLRRTIAAKVNMLSECEAAQLTSGTFGKRFASTSVIEYLRINIEELERILADVEAAMREVNYTRTHSVEPRELPVRGPVSSDRLT